MNTAKKIVKDFEICLVVVVKLSKISSIKHVTDFLNTATATLR